MFKNKKIFIIIFLIVSTYVHLVARGLFLPPAENRSYERYLSGEYYFRARAVTVATVDPLDPNALDPSDPAALLKGSTGMTVYVCNPHVPFCTVYYNGDIYEDYPLNGIRFADQEEEDIFYNRKILTADEYKDRLRGLKEDSPLLSDPKMLNTKLSGDIIKWKIFFTVVLAISVGMVGLLIFTHNMQYEELFKLIWYIWGVFCIVWIILSFVLF